MEEKLKELKARAYDLIAYREQATAELQQVNEEIRKILNEQAKADNVETTKKALPKKT